MLECMHVTITTKQKKPWIWEEIGATLKEPKVVGAGNDVNGILFIKLLKNIKHLQIKR